MIAAALTFLGIVLIIASGWGSAESWVVVILLALLWFGRMVWIDDARAHVNWMNYWSRNGKDRAMMRHRWNADAKEEEERIRAKSRKTYDQTQKGRGLQKAGMEWTAGNVRHENTTYPCPVCGDVMAEQHRVEYSSGAVYVTYKCVKCRKEMPVKVK